MGYQHEFLKYMEKGENERFGRIEFAVGCDVTQAFRQAAYAVPEDQWHDLNKIDDEGYDIPTSQQRAEVVYVPNAISHSTNDPVYRYIAIRTPVQTELFDSQCEQGQLTFDSHRVLMASGSYRVFGLVTNMAGGHVPVQEFGGNAAWWMIAAIASNLNEAM